jgi:two-component system, NtrC family, response regulator
MALGNILLIDDEDNIRKLLKRVILLEGYSVFDALNLKSANRILNNELIDVVLLDVKLPDGDGIEFINTIKLNFPLIEIIMLTAYGNIADGVQAIKNGAFSYLIKGEDNDRLFPLLAKAIEVISVKKKEVNSQSAITKTHSFKNIIGETDIIKDVIEYAKKVSLTDTTVLLLGETGTGKEVFARAIHENSKRSSNNFLALNCSSFNKELLESELFGYISGAFTGALKDKKGLMEEAQEGTLFLDEIGEMSYELQSKLLRVLETNEFIKVGDTKFTEINVRIIAATNRDLLYEVNEGRFREDLYYRLNNFIIILPPLRDRVKDIPLLANHFLQSLVLKLNSNVTGMTKEYLKLLEQHLWSGNIRELKNIMERAIILASGTELTAQNLPLEMQSFVDNKHVFSAFELASIEKLHIQRVLIHTNGNKLAAAKLLNIGLTTLYRKIDEFKITPPQSKHSSFT